jgi:hypothetical protein
MKLVETAKPTAGRAIDLLVAAGVLVETTGRQRDRSWAYQGYLDRLRAGTELESTVTRHQATLPSSPSSRSKLVSGSSAPTTRRTRRNKR